MDIFDDWSNNPQSWNDLKCSECKQEVKTLKQCKNCKDYFCKNCRESLREKIILSRIEDTPTHIVADEYFKVYSAVYNPKNRTKTTDRAIQKRVRAELEVAFPKYSRIYYTIRFNIAAVIRRIETGNACPHKHL